MLPVLARVVPGQCSVCPPPPVLGVPGLRQRRMRTGTTAERLERPGPLVRLPVTAGFLVSRRVNNRLVAEPPGTRPTVPATSTGSSARQSDRYARPGLRRVRAHEPPITAARRAFSSNGPITQCDDICRLRLMPTIDSIRRLIWRSMRAWCPSTPQSHSQSHSPEFAGVCRDTSRAHIPGHGLSRTVVNAEVTHTWKACWGQPLASSNRASSATSDQAIHKPRSCVRPGLARLRSLIRSLIHSTHIGIKRPRVQAHASECYRGCGCPLGVSALSDQLAAGAVTMGERLGSDVAWCSTQIGSEYALPVDGVSVAVR